MLIIQWYHVRDTSSRWRCYSLKWIPLQSQYISRIQQTYGEHHCWILLVLLFSAWQQFFSYSSGMWYAFFCLMHTQKFTKLIKKQTKAKHQQTNDKLAFCYYFMLVFVLHFDCTLIFVVVVNFFTALSLWFFSQHWYGFCHLHSFLWECCLQICGM